MKTNFSQPQFDVETISGEEQQRFVSILSFWHKLEFFIPFDLEQRIDEADEYKIRYLHFESSTEQSSTLWQVAVPNDEEVELFHLYLGIFDKSEITKICDREVGPSRDRDDEEEFERTSLEGRTCFAQLTVDASGNLLFELKPKPGPVSYVSTLPWALGQLEKFGLASLTSSRFENAKQSLAESLLNFKAARSVPADRESDDRAKPLTHSDILQLHELLQGWADFSIPNATVVGIVEAVTRKKKQEKSTKGQERTAEIAILNSFFIQDIEAAIKSIESGRINKALKQFLSPSPRADRISLESVDGLRTIWATLHPDRSNRGRWLANSDRSMTLMQQFAIHSILDSSTEAPALFSVNGPPGTGKTTLLQDVFADLIVRRARALSALDEPSDAFFPEKVKVAPNGGQTWHISLLRPEFTGFEMVVASSNNAAVEKISGDLPETGRLGSSWQAVQYLQSVAYKVAAQQDDGSFKKFCSGEEPWGLISCVLGKSANRKRFRERLFYTKVPEDTRSSSPDSSLPQTLLQWIERYSGPSFADAKHRFEEKHAEVEKNCARLQAVANIVTDHLDAVHEKKILVLRREIEQCKHDISVCEHERQECRTLIEHFQSSLTNLQEDERLLGRIRLGWWARLRRAPAAKAHAVQVRANAAAQLEIRKTLNDLKTTRDVKLQSRFGVLSNELSELEGELNKAETEKKAAEQSLEAAQTKFAELRLPGKLDDLQTDEFQKRGLWHLNAFAEQRSELFAAALSLHEAWLASVGRPKGGFLPNIYAVRDLLSGRFGKPSDALPIWQSLFLIVPVVSTTFASFHNQFGDLGPGSLGWLFVDEAGQAAPQAAVGAIWRAKRALIIGDPLQIEPVFTLPSCFISAVAELSPYTSEGSYSPNKVSVQRLADDANRLGVMIENKGSAGVWVGSPLRVHRRCIDPMFSWSNEIAYGNKMVFGLSSRSTPDGPPLACESSWINVAGESQKRQAVPEQTQFVLDLLLALYQRDRQLPNLYLISPFKAVKIDLTEQIRELDWTQGKPQFKQPKKKELAKWCKERVGTVHTFQGREEHTVLMILGVDWKHTQSADWACAKPNILNVALTRARRRFYVVGDRELWGAKGPFASPANCLPTISASRFLAIARHSAALGTQAGD